jgi:Alginate lyase
MLAGCQGGMVTAGDAANPNEPAADGAIDDAPLPDDGGDVVDDGSVEPDGATTTSPFRHPGVLVDKAQLDFVKAKIAAGAEPWTSAFTQAKNSRFGSRTYKPTPYAVVECGQYSNPDVGCSAEKNDATAAYTQALLWYFTGDATYAKNAAAILDAWSATLKDHINSNTPLQCGWVGAVLPRAGEILRYSYSAWPAANVARFGNLLRTVYLPKVINGAPNQNGNWELSTTEATMAIAVFLDDHATFDVALGRWRKRVPAYIYLKTDGALPVPPPRTNKTTADQIIAYWYGQKTFVDGVGQETCRDFGHLTLGFAAMVNAAETARIQGVDLYAEEARRIVAGYEFNTQYLDGVAAPSWLCGGKLDLSPNETWEIGYNEYANRLGKSLPHTNHVILKNRPSGATHHILWETLTHANLGNVGIQ